MEALATLSRVLVPFGDHEPKWRALAVLLLLTASIGWRIAVRRKAWRDWCRRNPVAAAVGAIMLAAPLLVWAFGFLLVPIFMPRTILIALPGLFLLLALLVHLEGKPWLGWVFVLIAASSLVLTGLGREKEGWRPVAEAIAAGVRPGDTVIVCPEWKYPALRHALVRPLPASGLTLLGDQMAMVDAAFDSDSGWMDRYFRALLEPQMRFLMKQRARLPVEQEEIAVKRAWVVESDCGEDNRDRLVRAWLGEGRWTFVIGAPQTAQRAEVRLWRFDPSAVVNRPVQRIAD